MHSNTTQAIFLALQQAGAISPATGFTATELATRCGFDKKITSTILGNLNRAKKARRVQEMRDNGYTHEYRYWVLPGTKARFNGTNGVQHPGHSQAEMAREVQAAVEQHHGNTGAGYLMQIKGPNNFRMEVELTPGKLPQVIQAANGGK